MGGWVADWVGGWVGFGRVGGFAGRLAAGLAGAAEPDAGVGAPLRVEPLLEPLLEPCPGGIGGSTLPLAEPSSAEPSEGCAVRGRITVSSRPWLYGRRVAEGSVGRSAMSDSLQPAVVSVGVL